MTKGIPNYYRQDRNEISSYISGTENDVLDIGCAAGYLGASLKKINKAKSVYGIEGLSHIANDAKTRLDNVKVADLESLDFNELKLEWNNKTFDYIVFGDVLEHLTNPWSVLESSKCFLKPHGNIIISLPNIRHWSVTLPLIFKGSWEYAPQGILDKTHLRFFSRSTAMSLVKDSNLDIDFIDIPVQGKKSLILSKLSMGFLNDLLGIQILIIAKLKQ